MGIQRNSQTDFMIPNELQGRIVQQGGVGLNAEPEAPAEFLDGGEDGFFAEQRFAAMEDDLGRHRTLGHTCLKIGR